MEVPKALAVNFPAFVTLTALVLVEVNVFDFTNTFDGLTVTDTVCEAPTYITDEYEPSLMLEIAGLALTVTVNDVVIVES